MIYRRFENDIYINTKYRYNTSLITENKVYDLSKSMAYRCSHDSYQRWQANQRPTISYSTYLFRTG